MERGYYVYIAFRPWNGRPCYVGKGNGRRWRVHLWRSHNIRLRRIITKAGGDIPIVAIRTNLTEAEAYEIEKAFIAAIGRGDRGPLVNMTDGGEGTSGHKQTDKTIERRVRARIRAGVLAANAHRKAEQGELSICTSTVA